MASKEPETPGAGDPQIAQSSRYQPLLAKLGGGDARIGAGLAAVLIATALVYSRSLGNQFIGDERSEIIDNPYLRHWAYLWQPLVHGDWWFRDPKHLSQGPYYRPLIGIWWCLNYHLFGFDVVGWRAATIVLHLLVVWLVFRIASSLANDRRTGLLAAALFALQPVHAESVVQPFASVPNAIFELSAFAFYLRAIASPADNARRRQWLACSLAMFAGALLSYETAIVFPLLIAAHAVIFGPFLSKRDPAGRLRRAGFAGNIAIATRRALSAAQPYLIEAAAYWVLRLSVFAHFPAPHPGGRFAARLLWRAVLGAVAVMVMSLVIRFNGMLYGPRSLVNYATLMLMPWKAEPIHHSLAPLQSLADSGFYFPAILIVVFCAVAFLLFRRHPHRRLYLFCAAWFLIAPGPIIEIDYIADRYTYLMSFGFCVAAADLAIGFADQGRRKAQAVRIGAAGLLCLYTMLLFSCSATGTMKFLGTRVAWRWRLNICSAIRDWRPRLRRKAI